MGKTGIQMITGALAKQYKLSASDASVFVDSVFAIISSELKDGRPVKVKGLGTFKIQSVKPRESVNVNTGERVLIKGHDKITFTPDAAMKELVNKPFSQFETVVINDGVDTETLERIPADEAKGNTSETIPTKSSGTEAGKQKDNGNIHEEDSVQAIKKQTGNSSAESGKVSASIEEKLTEKAERKPDAETENSSAIKEAEQPVTDDEPTHIGKDRNEEDKMNVEEEKSSSVRRSPEPGKLQSQPVRTVTETEEENDSDVEGSTNNMLKIVALAAFIVIVFLGGFLWVRFGRTKPGRQTAVMEQKEDTSGNKTAMAARTVPADTVTTAARESHVPTAAGKEETDSFAAMNSDRRIRYGAYNIVGIDRIVVLRKGQTMKSYSRKTLGADMVGYFQVLNKRNTMQAGDTMKVPKVELRPEYRK
ncbi:MAG: HU family DNA-binding protein [Prevotella multiformis]|uniref:DNA-binding protein HU n=1 Tax=Prevotella multiformis DSM 16608 TaxID=888743 RepID=F0F669_9BACT|nr:HU family DNA-binding protein [Prevotella multiformis]EGC20450.1 DNA-binding protein HU [Prevotella multiformis DSM 16608]